MFSGSCLCGVVGYEIDVFIELVSYCYCSQCCKVYGVVFVIYGKVCCEVFCYVVGVDVVVEYYLLLGVICIFCCYCGLNLQWFGGNEDLMYIFIVFGIFDLLLLLVVQWYIYVGLKVDWYVIVDDLLQEY